MMDVMKTSQRRSAETGSLDPNYIYKGFLSWAKVGAVSPLYSEGERANSYHRVYMIFVWAITFLHLSSQLADIVVNWGNISRVAQNLGFSICIVNNICRTAVVFFKPDAVKQIVRESSTFFRNEVVIPGVAQFDIRHWKIGARLWTMAYAVAGTSILAPLIVAALMVRLLSDPSGSVESRTQLPVKAWYPFDVQTALGWGMAYTLQVAALPFVTIMLVVGDGICVTVLATTCGQLELVRKEIQYIGQTALVNVKQMIAGRRVTAFDVELEKERLLAEYAETFKRILRFIKESDRAFTYVAFVNSWILTICLVTTAFEILNVDGLSIPRLVAIGLYLQTSVSFVFVYCYVGDKLIEEQDRIRVEMYRTDWIDATRNFKYILRYSLFRSQAPARITVGKLAILNLETYIAELNRAFTVFNAMLQLKK